MKHFRIQNLKSEEIVYLKKIKGLKDVTIHGHYIRVEKETFETEQFVTELLILDDILF